MSYGVMVQQMQQKDTCLRNKPLSTQAFIIACIVVFQTLVLATFFLQPLAAQIVPASHKLPSCGELILCRVLEGDYLVKTPQGWDGKTPLPALVFLHGYRETADTYMADQTFRDFADKNGVLLVLPNGAGQTWSYPGSPAQNRDEFVFMDQVLRDLDTRFPLNKQKLWVSGFSQGGSMVWYLACRMGNRFAAFAPVSGAFWMPVPEKCDTGAVNLRHIHGTSDPTVPMKGRPIGRQWRQGDVRESFEILHKAGSCLSEPPVKSIEDGMACETTKACSGEKQMKLCLHDGGHFVERSHLEASWAWVKSIQK